MTGKTDENQGLVPKLRFLEFRNAEPWGYRALSDFATLIDERVGNRAITPFSITSGIGLVSQQEKFGRSIAGQQLKNYLVIKKGDFAYNKSATKEYPQGFATMFGGDELGCVPSSIFSCFNVTDDAVSKPFLNYLLQGNLHGKWLARFLTVGARANGSLNIDDDDLLALPVPLPKGNCASAEQQKIDECLSSLDALIAAETEKLVALRDHKKGLTKQLFPAEGQTTPRFRFPEFRDAGEWVKMSAGGLFSNRVERGKAGLPIYSVTMNDGLLPRASLDRKIDDIGNVSANKSAKKGDIAYNMMRMWQGALGVAPEECMVSPAYVILEPKSGANPQFFSRLLKLPRTLRSLTEASRGLTEDRLRLYYDDFAKLQILCPPPPEQEKIADCLSYIDSAISSQRDRIDTIKAHKFGLMQQLFPSPAEVVT